MKVNAFSPFKMPVGNGKFIELKNRYMIPPMVSWVAKDGMPNTFHFSRYTSFAAGGFGGIICEATACEPRGRITYGCCGMWNDSQEKEWKKIVTAVHNDYDGVKIGIQIGHAGRRASTKLPWNGYTSFRKEDGGWEVISPTKKKFAESDQDSIKVMTIKDIEEVQDRFAEACLRAKRAGFDWVELHGAHGYLINQFLIEHCNDRKDKYGGSFENRCRFLFEMIDKIRKLCGDDFPVSIRLSVDQGPREVNGDEKLKEEVKKYNESRWTVSDSKKLIAKLIEKNIFMINCSCGGNSPGEKQFINEKCFYHLAEPLKKEFGNKITIATVGNITEAKQCKEIIEGGGADIVLIGKQALANPYTPIQHAQDLEMSAKDVCGMYVKQHGMFLYRNMLRKSGESVKKGYEKK